MEAHEAGHTARLAAADPRRAGRTELPQVRDLLTTAFMDDPVFGWGFRAGPGLRDGLNAYFDFSLDQQCAPHDRIYVAGDYAAAAAWLPASGLASLSIPAWRMMLMLPRMLQITGWSRLTRAMALGDAMEKHHPPEPPHWYLFFIGVAPALKGQGVGSALLEATLKQVDAERMPAYLDNSNPKNTRLYERHGFRAVSEYRAKPDAPPMLGMWRDARKA